MSSAPPSEVASGLTGLTLSASSAVKTVSSKTSEYGDCEPTPSYSREYPFTLYQHKVEFDPPLEHAATKYKILMDLTDFSPCIFNGTILFMARAVPPKKRITYYVDAENPRRSISWMFTFTGKVSKSAPMYRLFKELIFTPGVSMKVFNLQNESTDLCVYEYEKRFNAFSIISLHRRYKTTIRFSGLQTELIYCSEFADASAPKQRRYDFVPDPRFCINFKEYLANLFHDYGGGDTGIQEAKKLEGNRVLAPYCGKVYRIGALGFAASPHATFTERESGKRIRFIDHYRSKYGIEVPVRDQQQILFSAFPTRVEDIDWKGHHGNVVLIPSLCYLLKEWDSKSKT